MKDMESLLKLVEGSLKEMENFSTEEVKKRIDHGNLIYEITTPLLFYLTELKKQDKEYSNLVFAQIIGNLLLMHSDNIDEGLNILPLIREHLCEIDKDMNKWLRYSKSIMEKQMLY